MSPHHVIVTASVLRSRGLPVGGRRDHGEVAGPGVSADGKKAQHGVSAGEPHGHRRHDGYGRDEPSRWFGEPDPDDPNDIRPPRNT